MSKISFPARIPIIDAPGGKELQGWLAHLVRELIRLSRGVVVLVLPKVLNQDAQANKAVLYVRDNGAGKCELVVRFPTGAVQVISTEP